MEDDEIILTLGTETKKIDNRSIASKANALKARETKLMKSKIKQDLENERVNKLKKQEKNKSKSKKYDSDDESDEEIIYVKSRPKDKIVVVDNTKPKQQKEEQKVIDTEKEAMKREIELLKSSIQKPVVNQNDQLVSLLKSKILNF